MYLEHIGQLAQPVEIYEENEYFQNGLGPSRCIDTVGSALTLCCYNPTQIPGIRKSGTYCLGVNPLLSSQLYAIRAPIWSYSYYIDYTVQLDSGNFTFKYNCSSSDPACVPASTSQPIYIHQTTPYISVQPFVESIFQSVSILSLSTLVVKSPGKLMPTMDFTSLRHFLTPHIPSNAAMNPRVWRAKASCDQPMDFWTISEDQPSPNSLLHLFSNNTLANTIESGIYNYSLEALNSAPLRLRVEVEKPHSIWMEATFRIPLTSLVLP